MSNEQNNCRCEDCDELLKIYRGSCANWMSKEYRKILFCPCCGQIYIKDSNFKLHAIKVDEHEEQGN